MIWWKVICIVWKNDSSNASALPLSPAIIQTLFTFSLLSEDLKAIDNLCAPSFEADDKWTQEQKNEVKSYLRSDLAVGKATIIPDVWTEEF